MRLGSVLTGGLTLEGALLQRHQLIDATLQRLVEHGKVRQIVEIAGGLSARGVRFAERYRQQGLVYVEGDLPEMAERKRATLAAAGLVAPNHQIVPLNALVDDGALSLMQATRDIVDPEQGTAVVTEGLLPYFELPAVEAIWGRVDRFLRGFPHGVYVSDLNLRSAADGLSAVESFRRFLSWYSGGTVQWHFEEESEAVASLRRLGFASVRVHTPPAPRPRGAAALVSRLKWGRPGPPDVVRVLEAETAA